MSEMGDVSVHRFAPKKCFGFFFLRKNKKERRFLRTPLTRKTSRHQATLSVPLNDRLFYKAPTVLLLKGVLPHNQGHWLNERQNKKSFPNDYWTFNLRKE